MLTLFPDFLAYSFFGPTIVRLALGGMLIVLAHEHMLNRERTGGSPLFSLGLPTIEVISGALIILGLYTQIASLVALAIIVKLWFISKTRPSIVSPSVPTLILAGAIALLLIVTGPGAIAFDLPL